MAQEHELRLKINASAAKSGAKTFTTAIANIKSAVLDLDAKTAKTFTNLKKGKVQIDASDAKKASTALDQSGKSLSKFDQAAKRMANTSAAAIRVATSQMDRLQEKSLRLGDSTGIAKMAAEFERLQTRLAKAQTPLDIQTAKSTFADQATEQMRLNRSLEQQERIQNQAVTSSKSHAAALDNLRSKYNPLYAASRQYETALEEISRAESQGAITSKLASDARARAASTLQSASGAVSKYGNAMKTAGFQSQNAAYQIQDVFVTAEMGMNPMRIALQQGSQLSMVMNDMARTSGGAKGAISGLMAGVSTMINPMSLATIGVIAGGAALYQWAVNSDDAATKAETLADRLNQVAGAQDQLNFSVRGASLAVSPEELTIMDAIAAKSREIAESVNQQNSRRYRDQKDLMDAQTAALENERAGLQGQLADIRRLQAQKETMLTTSSAMADAERMLGEQMQQTASQATENARIADLLKDGISASVVSAMQLAGVDMTSPISSAAGEAARLASNLGIAYAQAVQLNYERNKEYVSSGRGGDPRDFMAGGKETARYRPSQAAITGASRILNPSAVKSGGGSRSKKLSDEARAAQQATTAIASRYKALQSEARALELVSKGQFASIEAAKLFAQAELSGKESIDAKTLAMLKQIDAASVLSDTQNTMQDGFRDGTKSAIESALNGEFSFDNFAQGMRSKLAGVLSDKLTDNLFPALSDTAQDTKRAAMLQAALTTGGASAAAQISAAMGTSGVRTAAVINASGTGHATKVGTAIQTSGQAHAAAVAGATQSGGGGGFLSYVGSLFGVPSAAQGMTTSGVPAVASATVSPAMFTHAPHYKDGTANTSGIPSILHENEAVIPLSKGRKVGVELSGGQGGSVYAPSTMGDININVESRRDGESDDTFAQRIAEAMGEQMASFVDGRISEANRYGGISNPR
ncbi:phage tail length tape measure family protein [Sulfitobacter geojensis]|uniref:phage tail length tape measure family protein n=1 Tax=Sulfitobacter geojensis TaxID=1342299 RepID=UPI0007D900E1|nr:phage tail length tape measure family protein [Sulfitobacter geojensis]OAN98064.1 hypothetical protein A8B74_01645 [Sulfitobacter geojensis]